MDAGGGEAIVDQIVFQSVCTPLGLHKHQCQTLYPTHSLGGATNSAASRSRHGIVMVHAELLRGLDNEWSDTKK